MLARIATALVGIPIILGAVSSTVPWYFAVLLVLIALLGVAEAWQLFESAHKTPPWATPLASLAWVLVPLAAVFVLYFAGVRGSAEPWNVRSPVLLAIVPLWVGDSAAYFVGKAIGRHLMAPAISPKKTWEGAIANFAGCVLAGWGVGVWIGTPTWAGLAAGALAGTLGQAGDLFQSWLKRQARLKDSGNLLPGHGGMLDRIDSLLFAAIPTTVVYFLASGR